MDVNEVFVVIDTHAVHWWWYHMDTGRENKRMIPLLLSVYVFFRSQKL